MLQEKYIQRLTKKIREYFPDKNEKIFIFGSAIREKKFHDIDIGFTQCSDERKLYSLQEDLEESTFPYIVDLVDFAKTSKEFSEYVPLREKKLWI